MKLVDSRKDYGDLSREDKKAYVGLGSKLRESRAKKKKKGKDRVKRMKARGLKSYLRRKNEKQRGH